MKYFLSFCIFLIMLVNVAHSAQIYKESSKVVYKKFSGSAKQEIMQLAFNQACSKAVSRHAESLDKSQYANYKKVKTKIENNLEEYVICTIIDDDNDKKSKTYTVAVKAEILANAFTDVINQSSSISDAETNEKTEIVFASLARQVENAQAVSEKSTTSSESSNSETTSEIAASDGVETIISGTTEKSSSATTGGDVQDSVSDVIVYSYSVDGNENFGGAMLTEFNYANYDIIDIHDLWNDDISDLYEIMEEEFASKGAPSKKTISKINKILKMEEEIGIFMYATIDIGQKEIDQSTGNIVTQASINTRIIDLTGKRPKNIAAVANQVIAGIGTTQDSSRKNAIQSSAEKSAQILIGELNKRGTR